MQGWIKINREIVNHWLWTDSERLKWWLDLLFMAQWDDKKVLHDSHLFTLKRGQIIASVAFLCERWEKSKMTVLKFLQMLEGEEMIKREILYRQTPIITICNYDKYQERLDTQIDTQIDTIVDRNKESKEYNNNNNNTRTREENDFVRELKMSSQWLEVMAIRYHTTTANIIEQIDDFALDAQCRGNDRHTRLNDIKAHFNNWLLRKLDNKNGTNGRKQNNQRRGFEVTATSAQDYEGAF